MAHFSGKELYMEFNGQQISGDHRSLTVSRSASTANTTAGADTAESHIVLTTSATFDITILDDTSAAGDAVRGVLFEGAEGTFTFGPQGNVAGKPKYSCGASVTSVQISYPYDNVVEIQATLTRNGDWIANYDQNPTDVFGP